MMRVLFMESDLAQYAIPLTLEEKQAVGACMPFDNHAMPLYICGKTSSSLDVAFALSLQGILPVWGAVQAMTQDAGRGQLRRAWISPLGNVHVTVRLPKDASFDGLAAAPAVGVLVCMALEALGLACQMKWPNDIIVQGDDGQWRKIGGILLEERQGFILAGIGLNRATSPPLDALREASMLETACLPNLNSSGFSSSSLGGLLQKLVFQLRICYDRWREENTEWYAYVAMYTAFVGSCVCVKDGEGQIPLQGTCLGISEQGALRLLVDGIEQHVFTGSLMRDI